MLLVYQVTKEDWQKFSSLCRAAYGCRYCLLLLHPTRWITLNVSIILNSYLGRWTQKEVILDILYNEFYNTMQTAIMSEQKEFWPAVCLACKCGLMNILLVNAGYVTPNSIKYRTCTSPPSEAERLSLFPNLYGFHQPIHTSSERAQQLFDQVTCFACMLQSNTSKGEVFLMCKLCRYLIEQLEPSLRHHKDLQRRCVVGIVLSW